MSLERSLVRRRPADLKLPRKILSQLDQVAVGVSHVGSALTSRSRGRSGDGRSTGSDKFRERSIAVGHLESKLEGRGRERRRIKHYSKGLLHGIPGIEREAPAWLKEVGRASGIEEASGPLSSSIEYP